MRGRSIPCMSDATTDPMTANWNRCSPVHSEFAPRSSMCVCPWRARIREMIAGRSMPSIVFSTKRPVAISAPVLPALTHACASPDFTRSMATRIEESFFLRKRVLRLLVHATTCEASRTTMRSPSARAPLLSAALKRLAEPDQDHAQVGIFAHGSQCRRHSHAWAVIAAHGIDRNREGCGGCQGLKRRVPREAALFDSTR